MRIWKPAIIILILALGLHALSLSLEYTRSGLKEIPADNALFQYGGWYITQGGIPYIDFWDVKPPLIYELTSVLSLLSLGDMYALHILSIIVTNMAAIGSVFLVGLLTYKLTKNEWASIAAAVTVLTLPGFYTLTAYGTRPKYFVIFFGLLSIYLYQNNYNKLLSAGISAISAGFWHFGLIFPLIILGLASQNEKKDVKLVLVGILLATFLFLLPVIIWNALGSMLIEVILAPLASPENQTIIERFVKIWENSGSTLILIFLGIMGLLWSSFLKTKEIWWVQLGALWFAVQILFIDFDSYPDLFLFLIFIAIGVGLLAHVTTVRIQKMLTLLVIAILFINPVWGYLPTTPLHSLERQSPFSEKNFQSDIENMYWNKTIPTSCHIRMSEVEINWIEKNNLSAETAKCGRWSFLNDSIFMLFQK